MKHIKCQKKFLEGLCVQAGLPICVQCVHLVFTFIYGGPNTSCSYITSVMMLFKIYIAMLFSLVISMGHTRFVIQYVTDFPFSDFLKDEICKYVNNFSNIISNIYVFINIFM